MTLPIVKVSREVILLTVNVMVMVEASVMTTAALAMSRPTVKAMSGVTPVLN